MKKIDEKLIVTPGNYGNVIVMSGGAGCLAGSTLVKTTSGYKPIQYVEPGEEVYSFNEKTGDIELKKVHAHFERGIKEVFELSFDNETVVCTKDHEFWINEHWVKACDLVNFEFSTKWKEMTYDLHIEDNHIQIFFSHLVF